jgi:hypothetical protein
MDQPSHWTYRSFDVANPLQQGDIIRRSPALLKVLSDVLSHFCDERYTAFLVVTQSCDLVQRNGEPCKAEYINLCVVRELVPLLPTILEPCCGAGIPGIFTSDNRRYAEQLLKRVLNQNEQARGLFYLHKDSDAGIHTRSVALLRVSIALRRKHYGMLQECRCGRLAPEYSAKLGWLTGNLYSRVATPDWEDQERDREASSKQAQSLLEVISKPGDENWVPVKWVKAAREKNIDLTGIPIDRFHSTLAAHAPPNVFEVVLESVARVGRKVVVDPAYVTISRALAGHDQFAREVAQRAVSCAAGLLSAEEQTVLLEYLATDARFREAIGNHVASQFMRNVVEIGDQAINSLPDLLTGTGGIVRPASKEMRTIVSDLLGPNRANEVSQIVGLVAGTCLFSPAATEIAEAVGKGAFAQFDFTMLEKLVSRLKNDQKLGAACREQSSDQAASSLMPD